MPIKKPLPPVDGQAKPSTRPDTGKNPVNKPGSRPVPDQRWQRTKRHSWDSR